MFNRSGFNRTAFNKPSSAFLDLSADITTRTSASGQLSLDFTMVVDITVVTSAGGRLNNAMALYPTFEGTSTTFKAQVEVEHIETLQRSMNAPVREIFGMVEITYTDPFNDFSLEFAASEQAYNTRLPDLADGVAGPRYKWFNLHENKLDGSYHPIGTAQNRAETVGWWGTTFSDSTGRFSKPPMITITFSSRALVSLSVSGDPLFENMPVDFDIKAYDSRDVLVLTKAVTGNTLYTWFEAITPLYDVTKLELIVRRINKPNTTPKITEFFTAIKEVYEGNIVANIELLEETGYTSGSLPMGNVSSNEIDITLSNIDRRFDLNNKDSILYGYVKRNRQVKAWLGAMVYGSIQWAPLGTFWTTQWDIRKDSLTATLVARDRLELMRRTYYERTLLRLNQNAYVLFEDILADAGLLSDEYIIDTSLMEISIPFAWFERMTHRDALQRLASFAPIQVYCTKDNIIKVDYKAKPTSVSAVMDDDVNVISANYPLAVVEQVNSISVTHKKRAVSDETIELVNGAGTVVPPGRNIISFIFSQLPAYSVDSPQFTAVSGVSIVGTNAYNYGIDIEFNNTTGANQTMSSLIIKGRVLSTQSEQVLTVEDSNLIQEDGRITQEVAHDFIQSEVFAKSLAEDLLNTYKSSRYDVTLETRGDITVPLNGKLLVLDGDAQTSYTMTRQSLRWDGSLSATVEGKKL